MNDDVHSLTGAYALDAVSDVERQVFEDHLAACDPCRQEVLELRITAARLGLAAGRQAPSTLWPRVHTALRPRRWWSRRAVHGRPDARDR
jgi:anti-sigma factor RsiW